MTREEKNERVDAMGDAGAQAWGLSRRAVLRRLSRRVVVEVKRRVPREPTADGRLAAGAAEVDITPPPGLPMAGYSVMGQLSRGMRTRLKARALYIRPHRGRPVALVVCDLLSGSAMLHHRVAELVASATDVDLAGLLVAGTHTHSAPGNYFESVFYNSFASGAPGFDAEWFRFLSERVARAVTEAFRDAKPALLATGSTLVTGATENRSPAAFARNRSIALPEVAECGGVNPWMHMIRADCLAPDGRYHPRAAFSVFSIHPTALDPGNPLYNGDVFAWMERRLENEVGKRFSPPWPVVHVAANHTHGDCTPRFTPGTDGGFAEARRVGESVGDQAMALFASLGSRLSDQARVEFWAEEFDVQKNPAIGEVELCRPAVGLALTAGSTTRATPVLKHLPFFAPGWPRRLFAGSGQGAKRVAGGIFQPLFLRTADFPRRLFLQALRVQDLTFLPLPFEICCEAGMRVQESARAAGAGAGLPEDMKFVCVGCANGYWGYVTTPEEYSMQYYEGGHTLYGPKTAPFLAAHAARAVRALAEKEEGRPFPDTFRYPQSPGRYWPRPAGDPVRRRALTRPRHDSGGDEPFWAFRWKDADPGRILLSEPLVRVEFRGPGDDWSLACDDSGTDIAVILEKHAKNAPEATWEARWHNPAIPHGAKARFAILGRNGEKPLYSREFSMKDE